KGPWLVAKGSLLSGIAGSRQLTCAHPGGHRGYIFPAPPPPVQGQTPRPAHPPGPPGPAHPPAPAPSLRRPAPTRPVLLRGFARWLSPPLLPPLRHPPPGRPAARRLAHRRQRPAPRRFLGTRRPLQLPPLLLRSPLVHPRPGTTPGWLDSQPPRP